MQVKSKGLYKYIKVVMFFLSFFDLIEFPPLWRIKLFLSANKNLEGWSPSGPSSRRKTEWKLMQVCFKWSWREWRCSAWCHIGWRLERLQCLLCHLGFLFSYNCCRTITGVTSGRRRWLSFCFSDMGFLLQREILSDMCLIWKEVEGKGGGLQHKRTASK